jgi:hypothetical protein
MILPTSKEVNQFLTANFLEDFTYWECDTRQMFMLNTNGTGSFKSETSLGYNLAGQIGRNVDAYFNVSTQTAVFVSKMTLDNKQHTLTSQVVKDGDTYSLFTFSTYLKDKYLANIEAIKKTAAYSKAVELLNGATVTNDAIATQMASALYTCVKNVPSILPTAVTASLTEISESGKFGIKTQLFINGVEARPDVIRYWLYPDKAPAGVPLTQKNGGGEFLSGIDKFFVTTDFNNREDVVVMHPAFRVDCQIQYKLASGKLGMITTSKQFSTLLPSFNYFGV